MPGFACPCVTPRTMGRWGGTAIHACSWAPLALCWFFFTPKYQAFLQLVYFWVPPTSRRKTRVELLGRNISLPVVLQTEVEWANLEALLEHWWKCIILSSVYASHCIGKGRLSTQCLYAKSSCVFIFLFVCFIYFFVKDLRSSITG